MAGQAENPLTPKPLPAVQRLSRAVLVVAAGLVTVTLLAVAFLATPRPVPHAPAITRPPGQAEPGFLQRPPANLAPAPPELTEQEYLRRLLERGQQPGAGGPGGPGGDGEGRARTWGAGGLNAGGANGGGADGAGGAEGAADGYASRDEDALAAARRRGGGEALDLKVPAPAPRDSRREAFLRALRAPLAQAVPAAAGLALRRCRCRGRPCRPSPRPRPTAWARTMPAARPTRTLSTSRWPRRRQAARGRRPAAPSRQAERRRGQGERSRGPRAAAVAPAVALAGRLPPRAPVGVRRRSRERSRQARRPARRPAAGVVPRTAGAAREPSPQVGARAGERLPARRRHRIGEAAGPELVGPAAPMPEAPGREKRASCRPAPSSRRCCSPRSTATFPGR
jgi:hypothetical protein